MSRIIPKNKDPKVNEFGPDDFVLNTRTGDLFAKANNQLFKIVGRNQFDQSTTDDLLKLLETSTDTSGTGSFEGFNTIDGFYGISITNALTGSNVSLHGGINFDYGQPLPNSPYIKTNGGFDILMDNADVYNNSSFRVFKDTGIAGVGGSELLKLDNEGNLTVSGSILTSESGGNISGSLTINGNLEVSGTSALNGDITIPKSVKLYFDSPSGMHVYSEGTAPGENQIIVAKTNNLRILNQAHGKDIIFGTENASGTAKTPLTLSSSGDSTFGGNVTITGNIVATGDITAKNYIVSSSITHLTTQTLSGSTTFGDTADDTHKFTGHITASGNISSSGTITAAAAVLTTADINGGTIDGITSLTAGGNLDIGAHELRASTFESDVSTGTAPFTVASTTEVANLHADTATTLHTARTIGGVSFNGSANIDLPGVTETGDQDTSGNALTATTLATARNINGVSFNGSANITITAAGSTLSDTVTVAKGGTGATSFADKSVIITQDSGTDTLAAVAMSTNGQLLIGGTSGPAVAVPTGGDGLTVTVGDGTLEYDLDAALTTVTSVVNSSLEIGRDADNRIKFGTDNQIIFEVSGGDNVIFKASGEIEASSLDISGDVDVDGTMEADAITLGGVTVLAAVDEDNMASNSATLVPTQQSVKAYVDANAGGSGDITSVVAGTGLTGGATTGDATLNVIGGDGITANANDIAITAAQTTITSILATDLKIGEDDQTKIDFETANEIHFYANNVEQIYLADNIFGPQSDSDVDLGTTGVRWKDAFVDSMTSTGAITAGGVITGTGFTAGNAVIAEAELELLDGLTAGTAIASKVVTTDANIDTTGQRNLTISGELDAATGDFSGAVDIAGDLTLSAGGDGALVFGTAGQNSIKIPDNQSSALIIEQADVAYMTFDTTNSSEIITIHPRFNVAGAFQIGGTSVTSTAAELNILDGVTSTAAELNILDGVTSTAAELNILDGVTSTAAELNILDGVTSTAAELNALDGITAVVGELNALDIGATAVGTAVASKAVILDSNKDYTGIRNLTVSGELDAATGDFSGAVDIAGDLTLSAGADGALTFGAASSIKIVDNQASALVIEEADTAYMTFTTTNSSELITANKGFNAAGAFQIGGTAVTSTAAELNILDGVTSTAAELNILDGVTSTAAELNILDGVTSTAAELNILDGVTSTAAELNFLDAVARGKIIYGNASGATALLSPGGANQVLTSDGTDISWVDAANTNIANTDLTLNAGRILNVADNNLEIKNGSTLYLGFDDSGINSFLASDDLDIGNFNFRAKSFTSDVSTGTAPFIVSSTTPVANLQAATATILHTARNINGVSFNGSANITVTAAGSTLSDTVTVAKGGTGATSFADKSVIITQDSGTDTLAAVAMSTNGQLLIGGTSGPAVAVPTGGDGLTVTVGDGTLEYDLDAALTTVTSILATNLKIGEDDQTKIDFETADEIHFYAANVEQVYLADNIFGPQSDSDVDLGTTGVRWKDAYVDSITVTGEVDAVSLDISGDADIDGTTNLDAVDIDGNVQLDGTFTVGVNDTGYDVTLFGATSNRKAVWDASQDHLKLYDNTKLVLGTGAAAAGFDSSLYHDGSNLYLTNTTGDIILSDNTVKITAGTSGEANLILESDTDNNDENDNPFIVFTQDGGAINGYMGLTGDADKWPDGGTLTGATGNGLVLGTKGPTTSTNSQLFLAAGDAIRLTILNGGNVGIGTTTPSQKLEVAGNINLTGIVTPGLTFIKILPSDFIPDDVGRPAMIDDTGSDRWLESHSTAKLYASVEIPLGFKATHVDLYGSGTSAVTVYEADIDSKTVTSKGTGNIGTQINITDVTADATNYLLIELAQTSGEEVYGGKITIAKA